eukprot:2111519-Pleurochrysis_carterae.AAC.1
MLNSVVPEADRRGCGYEIGAGEFHNRADRSLCYSIQFVHVRRACGRVGSGAREVVGEARRQEFTRVIRVQRADDLSAFVLSMIVIEESGERSDELSHVDWCFRLCAHG